MQFRTSVSQTKQLTCQLPRFHAGTQPGFC